MMMMRRRRKRKRRGRRAENKLSSYSYIVSQLKRLVKFYML
jgi:hypothetical protein